jgi:hypothetical protein
MLKKIWTWLLGKTTIDEKIVETVKTVEERVERIKEETADLVEAVKEVKEQAVDVVEAAQGTARKGRKPAAKPAAPKTSTRKPKASK